MLAIISSRYQYGPFLFFVAEVMSNDFTTDGLKKIFSTPGGPLRPEARGICHICHMVDPAQVPVSKLRVRRKVAVSWKKQWRIQGIRWARGIIASRLQ